MRGFITLRPGFEVIKLFSCSIQLRLKFQLVIITKMLKYKDPFYFQTLRCCINHVVFIMLMNVVHIH